MYETGNAVDPSRPAVVVKNAIDETNGILLELGALLTELCTMLGGETPVPKADKQEAHCMIDELVDGRNRAKYALEQALKIRALLFG